MALILQIAATEATTAATTADEKFFTEDAGAAAGALKTGTEVPAGAHAKKPFPPLDPHTFAPQLIWLALTFGTLYFLLSRVILPRIGGVIGERKAVRQRDLDEAERLKSETDKALKDYEKSLADAKGRAGTIAQTTRDKLKAEVDAERARVDKLIADTSAAAESRITTAKNNALAQVSGIAGETAEAIVAQLIGHKISRDEALAAVNAVRGA